MSPIDLVRRIADEHGKAELEALEAGMVAVAWAHRDDADGALMAFAVTMAEVLGLLVADAPPEVAVCPLGDVLADAVLPGLVDLLAQADAVEQLLGGGR